MGFIKDIVGWFFKQLNPSQICTLCLLATITGGYIVSTQFVRASEMEVLRAEMREISTEALEAKIIDTRIRQCHEPPESRKFYTRHLTELLRKYQEKTHTPFILPECSEL